VENSKKLLAQIEKGEKRLAKSQKMVDTLGWVVQVHSQITASYSIIQHHGVWQQLMILHDLRAWSE
jgi:hypothetical protein